MAPVLYQSVTILFNFFAIFILLLASILNETETLATNNTSSTHATATASETETTMELPTTTTMVDTIDTSTMTESIETTPAGSANQSILTTEKTKLVTKGGRHDDDDDDDDRGGGGSDGVGIDDLTWDDATWILLASFVIFTMQTGFGMLECGCVSVRSETNIMMKNVVDVVFGGFTYWLFGFSLSFGTDGGSSPFIGIGSYVVDADTDTMGPVFAAFMFQLSFATTATTIVSGTMAERCDFKSYCVFSLLNTIVYCVPARWIWGPTGFLGELGVIDIAGSGAVHLLGGVSGFTAAWMLGPRLGRYENGIDALPLGNPASCLVGLYILWWGWLVFNSGSTFGVSGQKWKFAARAAVTTIIASFGGGIVGSAWTLIKPGRIFEVMDIINPILGALVGVTAGCALFRTFDAFIVGAIGGVVIIMTSSIADRLRVDDPVGATCVHGFGGIWGLVAVALFAEDDQGLFTKGNFGLFRGGNLYLLQVQLLAAVCIIVWSFCITFSLLWVINQFVPIRMDPHEELLGADYVEHMVHRRNAGISPAMSAMGIRPNSHVAHNDIRAIFVGTTREEHTRHAYLEAIRERGVGTARFQKRIDEVRNREMAASVMKVWQNVRRSAIGPRKNEVQVIGFNSEETRQDVNTVSKPWKVVRDALGSPIMIRRGDQLPIITE